MNYLSTPGGEKLLNRYLRGKSKASKKGYQSEVSQFFEWFGRDIADVEADTLDRYRRLCAERGLSPSSVKRKFSIIAGFLKLAEKTTRGRVKSPVRKRGDLVRYSAGHYVDSESFRTLADGFLSVQNTATTRKAYINHIRQFFRFADKQPAEINMDDLFRWKAYLMEGRHKPATIRAYFSGLSTFFKYLRVRDRSFSLSVNVKSLGLKSPRKRSYRDVFTKEEIRGYLNCIRSEQNLMTVRDYALFRFVYDQALRINEACTFRVGDILRESGGKAEVSIRARKWGVSTPMILEPGTMRALREWMETSRFEYESGTPVFLPLAWSQSGGYVLADHAGEKPMTTRAVQSRFAVWLRRADADPGGRVLNCHSIRHSRATHMAQAGAPLFELMEFLGHRNLETTQIYLHSIRQEFDKHVGMYR